MEKRAEINQNQKETNEINVGASEGERRPPNIREAKDTMPLARSDCCSPQWNGEEIYTEQRLLLL